LNQPWRAAVAGGEVVLAVLMVLAAVWCWRNGVITMTIPKTDTHPDLVSTRYIGSWISGAIGLGTVAALLVVAALRQVLLALRTRDRQALPPLQTAALPPA
jgi:hypothetical protein